MLVATKGYAKLIDTYTHLIELPDFPIIDFDNHDYNISLRMINIETSGDVKSQYITLNTTAIDKNTLNPSQELYGFRSNGSNYIFAEPSLPRKYKIQLKELHTADFFLSSLEAVDYQIAAIFLLFEITRDARIQQVLSA